ncbi:ATPase [Chitinolyticbacter meiyuanensis]|uniref:Dph6-related ATP pyrophosphatase n=1 Tax=Chitinolyticbacter meiyuanensis TaxID=682798 RepID=UPI0011E5ACAD|nr:ATPase [Chitinolyticbacter meiyuanensis]
MDASLNVVVSWSSGKDSALSLLRLREDARYNVVGLCTTHVDGWVPYQNTPLAVVKAQAQRLGLPLVAIALPQVFPANTVYQRCVVDGLKVSGLAIEAIAFGDLFHNGIADYRRSYIEPAGWQSVFPLMGEPPTALAAEILGRGIRTRVVTVDTDQLDGRHCAAWYDAAWLASLPPNVDPCGENGEFHTLVTDMPGFSRPLTLLPGEVDRSGRFHVLRFTCPG